jgi:hypothetical protein
LGLVKTDVPKDRTRGSAAADAPVNSEIIFGKIDQAMRLRHLIEDAHPLAPAVAD